MPTSVAAFPRSFLGLFLLLNSPALAWTWSISTSSIILKKFYKPGRPRKKQPRARGGTELRAPDLFTVGNDRPVTRGSGRTDILLKLEEAASVFYDIHNPKKYILG